MASAESQLHPEMGNEQSRAAWYCNHLKGHICIWPYVAHQVRAYPSFHIIKRLGVFLLPPGWDASPSQGYPQHYIPWYVQYTYLYT